MELVIRLAEESADRSKIYKAAASLLRSASAGSGGLGSASVRVSVIVMLDDDVFYIDPDFDTYEHIIESGEIERFIERILKPLSASEARGGSRDTLKSISVDTSKIFQIDEYRPYELMPNGILGLLHSFPHVESVDLPYALDEALSAISAALPGLRSAAVRLYDSAPLVALGSHPALEKLALHAGREKCYGDPVSRGFERFSMNPAGRRLRELGINFGIDEFADLSELSSVGRLTSLETVELKICLLNEVVVEEIRPDVYEQAFAGLEKLRHLGFCIGGFDSRLDVAHLRGLTRAMGALRAHSLVSLRLSVAAKHEPEATSELAELLHTAGSTLVSLRLSASLAQGPAFAAVGGCTRLLELQISDYSRTPPDWLVQNPGVLAGLHQLKKLNFSSSFSSRFGPAHLRSLACDIAALRAHSLGDASLTLSIRLDAAAVPSGVDAALVELLRAAGPALKTLSIGAAVLQGDAARALAACSHLQRLDFEYPKYGELHVPVSAIVDALAACSRLKSVSCLPLPFDSEWEATEGLEPLRRLRLESLEFGFKLLPGPSLQGEELKRVKLLAERRVRSIFPLAAQHG